MIELIVFLFFAALIMETVDSSLGMMYGTLLSPVLIGFGFEPLMVVPALLISQAIGGIGGTVAHHKFRNANFRGLTRDTKVTLAMVIPGSFVVIIGVFLAINLPTVLVKTYIGILVIVMSGLCLSPIKYKFVWWKHYVVGTLAAFNKALSGGGFGPVTSTGGIIGGLKSRVSVATTTFAEVWICFISFFVYLLLTGKANTVFICSLSAGAIIGGIIGPYISAKVKHIMLRRIIGIFGIISGMWLLYKVLV